MTKLTISKNSKKRLCQLAEAQKNIFTEIATDLHQHPELSGQEFHAAALLKRLLQEQGFSITPAPLPDFPTAFIATKGNGPVHIGFLAEYDALPGLGHGCGHNLIAAMSTLAACISAEAFSDQATIQLFGCPAEETIGSKVYLAQAGLFDQLDAALICHPSAENAFGGTSYATHPLRVTFLGQSAHVADPDYHGINALDALVDFYTQLQALEQSFTKPHILGKIITEGGLAPNIIPDRATLKATIRALDTAYLEAYMLPAIKALARRVATAHGTGLELEHYEPLFMNLQNNKQLEGFLQANFQLSGLTDMHFYPDDYADGSTDVGNVSHAAPTLQAEVKIGANINAHTPAFAAAAGSAYGLAQAFRAAQALAMTAADVIFTANAPQD